MTPDQLRELADALEPMAQAPQFVGRDIPAFCAYLRACADASEPTEVQIKARDALLDFISENGTASEGVQYYLDRYVRAALAAKDNGNAGE